MVIGLMDRPIIYACYALLNVQHVLPKLFVKAAKQIFIYKPQIVLYLQIVLAVLTLIHLQMNVQHVHLFAKYVLGLYITRVPNVMTLTFYKNQLLLVLQLVKADICRMDRPIIYACSALLNVQHVLP